MNKVTTADVNKFIIFLLSNEKASLRDNPFNDSKERAKLNADIRRNLEDTAKEIQEREV